jgi:hypothetical protein
MMQQQKRALRTTASPVNTATVDMEAADLHNSMLEWYWHIQNGPDILYSFFFWRG